MKTKIGIVFFITLFISLYRASSQNTFEVVASDVRGYASYYSAFDKMWKQLINNTKLFYGDSVKLVSYASSVKLKGNGRFITLVNSKDKSTIGLNDKLFEKIEKEGVAGRIAGVFADLFFEEPKVASPAIHRGGVFNDYPMLFPGDNEVLIHDSLNFKWRKDSRKNYYFLLGKYYLLLEKNLNFDSLLCKNDMITDTMININDRSFCSNISSLDKKNSYGWTIAKSSSGQIDGYFLEFTFATAEAIDSLNQELKEINKSKSKYENEVYDLIIATCYEMHKMYSEADKIYQDAKQKYPGSAFIINSYQKFINRIIYNNQPLKN